MPQEDKVTITQMMESVPSNWPWPLVRSCLIKLDKRTQGYISPTPLQNEEERVSMSLSLSSPISEYENVSKTPSGEFYRTFNRKSIVFVMLIADDSSDEIDSYQIQITGQPHREGIVVGGGLLLGAVQYPTVESLYVDPGVTVKVKVGNPSKVEVRMASMPLE